MFSIRTNVLSVLSVANLDGVDSYEDFTSTDYADAQVKLGAYSISSSIIGVGDLRIIDRSRMSWGKNIVKSELDIILFTRQSPTGIEEVNETELSIALSKSELGSDDVLITELKKATGLVQTHDNIWSRRWVLEVTALETINS